MTTGGGCNRVMLLLVGFFFGTLPGLLIGLTSKYSYNFVATIHQQLDDCTVVKKEIPISTKKEGISDNDDEGKISTTATTNNGDDNEEPPPRDATPLIHPNWCPQAECTNTDLCHPCRRRFLIVIATARSASTTLTWMLNELPGVRMSGENNNHLDMVWNMYNNLWNHTSFNHGSERKNAWGHNYIPRQNFACAAQATVEAINPPPLMDDQKTIARETALQEQHDIIGFKTIRFDRGAQNNYTQMVQLVKENFPCSRVIININSNVTRQAASFRAAKFFHISENSLRNRNSHMKEIQQMFGTHQAYLLDSSKWTKDVNVLNDVVEWLGYHKSCQFQELLEFNTAGGKGFQNAKEQLSSHSPDCKAIQ